ncbi:hypothetical protein [Roseovarius faecimaris]|uniref:hypothetical protein n=1 Tax=Roseovarius faecimaris TaxID=2494550 RepID=UPI0018E0473F|nr:hypothetical protein [Roseovarius faecimaris]
MRALLLLPLVVLAAIPFLRPLLEPRKPDPALLRAAYDVPLPAPEGPLAVFHLGHSLVGRDMPAMLAQLAGAGHRYESQLGWGTSLKEHWQGGAAINGFEAENDHPRYRDARAAIGSGDYDAVVLTEMVELRDAIKYHDSAGHLARWADLVRGAGPDTRIYLYESWHRLDDPDGWLERLDADLDALWVGRVLGPDLRANQGVRPVRVIPAGQVMAAFVRAVEAKGGIGNIDTRESLFARTSEGALDPIHINDLGAYLVALTHYAVLYHRSPEGLPHALMRADGTPAEAPTEEAARLMQRIVWQVVRDTPLTGVGP